MISDDRNLLEAVGILEELKRRKNHAFQKYVPDDNPGRNQLGFHSSKAWIREILGGNRSGKSRSSAQEILWYATETHPYQKTPKAPRIWVVSAEYRTIYEGIWLHIKNNLPDWYVSKIGPKIQNYDFPSYIEFKSGARIDFLSAVGGDEARKKFQAAEIDLLAIDEEISGEFWEELQMRLLTRGGRVIISATLVQSEEWLLDLEDQAKESEDVAVFRFDTRLNKYNDEKLLAKIIARLSDDEKEVRIYGRRRRTTGLVYSTFGVQNECRPFAIPAEWTRVMCIDAGFRVSAALYVAIAPDRKRYIYREIYIRQGSIHDLAHQIKVFEGFYFDAEKGYQLVEGKEPERIFLRLIDPTSFRHLEDGSVGVGVQLSTDYGIHCSPGQNDKLSNIEAVRRLLIPDRPELFVFDNCSNFLTEIKKYRLRGDTTGKDRDESPDRPLKRHDHLMNCLEYIAMENAQFIPGLTPVQQLRRDVIEKVSPKDSMHRVRMIKERMKMRNEQLKRGV